MFNFIKKMFTKHQQETNKSVDVFYFVHNTLKEFKNVFVTKDYKNNQAFINHVKEKYPNSDIDYMVENWWPNNYHNKKSNINWSSRKSFFDTYPTTVLCMLNQKYPEVFKTSNYKNNLKFQEDFRLLLNGYDIDSVFNIKEELNK